jgi:hypothetical protein
MRRHGIPTITCSDNTIKKRFFLGSLPPMNPLNKVNCERRTGIYMGV